MDLICIIGVRSFTTRNCSNVAMTGKSGKSIDVTILQKGIKSVYFAIETTNSRISRIVFYVLLFSSFKKIKNRMDRTNLKKIDYLNI